MTTDAVGGVWQYSTDLCASLAEQGHRLTLAVLGPEPTASQRSAAQALRGVELIETGLPLDWLAEGAEEVQRAASALADLAAEREVDLVHCNSPALAGAAEFPVPLVAVAHGCVATWWQATRAEPLDPAFRWHADLARRGLLRADAVIAPSASFAGSVRSTYRLPRTPTAIHNGRRGEASAPAGHHLHAAVTVGRLWDEAKNTPFLNGVAAHLPHPFLAAGPLRGPHGEEVAPAHLRCLGQMTSAEVSGLLALQPVFVSAARFEPFGLAVLEAAAAGCALVLSDIPTFRELWDGAAVFADPQDEQAFAARIAEVLGDEEQRRRLGTAAAARAARYTPEATAAGIEGVYYSLLSAREAAA
ncbi:glycosyl transferase family 1 [Altererythrobacter sp. B11]|uniref:glycosyltransferase family 4 protein n=1 Tax=Altererythrobacter sp. B11 TaxID=2060312 RepID=UPI000DC70037|nr:glycosyltransferase family 4 protein [Altererythrobacter sp. B11]BBC72810.1 glycosyl transferase family 1 [Altererythrobacter sp. B11]